MSKEAERKRLMIVEVSEKQVEQADLNYRTKVQKAMDTISFHTQRLEQAKVALRNIKYFEPPKPDLDDLVPLEVTPLRVPDNVTGKSHAEPPSSGNTAT